MSIWESILIALDNVRINKLRSFLTMIGIVFGVGAVVTVVSIGQAGQQSVLATVSSYKDGYFVLYPDASDTVSYTNALFRMSDIQEIGRLNSIAHASVSQMYYLNTPYKDKELNLSVTATTADVNKLTNIKMIAGRFFTGQEVRSRQKVIVVDEQYAQKVFGSAERAIQRKVKFTQGTFRIIGVYDAKKSILDGMGGERFYAYVPLDTLAAADDGTGSRFDMLEATASDPEQIDAAIREVKKWVAAKHRVPADIYRSETAKEAEKMVSSTFGILQVIIGSIAGISLLVGGIGVMNIMLVSVTERTREIGIRKAIGATPGAIRFQFLIEAVMLSVLGGILGTLFGMLASYVFALITGWPFVISAGAILIAFVFSSAVGIFFGFYPASKASKLHPIDALRYE